MANPFSAKAKKNSNNPFAAKVKNIRIISDDKPTSLGIIDRDPPTKPKLNPFAARAKNGKQERIEELDRMIAETEQRYEDSLSKALKGGVNRDQIKKLFDASDRHMSTLLRLCNQRKHLANIHVTKEASSTAWVQRKKRSKRHTATPKKENASNSKSKVSEPQQGKALKLSSKSSKPAVQTKKKASTRQGTGLAQRTRRQR